MHRAAAALGKTAQLKIINGLYADSPGLLS